MRIYTSSASFQRPTGAVSYLNGYMVANSATPASVVPMTFTVPDGFLLTSVKLVINQGTLGYVFSLNLYQFSPTVQTGSGDNNFYNTDEAGYLGSVNLDVSQFNWTQNPLISQNNSIAFTAVDPNFLQIITDTTAGVSPNQVYGLLEVFAKDSTAISSAATFTVTLRGVD